MEILFTGDPDAISRIPARLDVSCLQNGSNKENLQLVNLMYVLMLFLEYEKHDKDFDFEITCSHATVAGMMLRHQSTSH